MSPEIGAIYELTLSDGRVLSFRFDGFGEYMSPQWCNLATNEVVANLPPYRSVVRLGNESGGVGPLSD